MRSAPIAVVTGGAGFIGANLSRLLLEQGFEVRVVDTVVEGNDRTPPGAVRYGIDIRDAAALGEPMKGASYVFHLAALPRVQDSIDRPVETHSVNVDGTLSVLEAARKAGVQKVVFSSSAAVYGDQDTMPLAETLPADPKSPYGLHKRMGEEMCRAWSLTYGVPTVSLRYFNVYGKYFDPKGAYALVVGKFIERAAAGQDLTIAGDGSHTRDYVHVEDVAAANVLAAQSDAVGMGEILNIGTGIETSVREIADLVGGAVAYGPARFEPARACADPARARALLGWKPAVALPDGIAALKEWYAQSIS